MATRGTDEEWNAPSLSWIHGDRIEWRVPESSKGVVCFESLRTTSTAFGPDFQEASVGCREVFGTRRHQRIETFVVLSEGFTPPCWIESSRQHEQWSNPKDFWECETHAEA